MKKDRYDFRHLCLMADSRKKSRDIQSRYDGVLKSLKNKSKFRVLFLVNENSKWKAQSLYDEMINDDCFEPIICLTIADIQKKCSKEEKQKILNENKDFFEKRGMNVVLGYDITNNSSVDLKEFLPDIVFYQQPYNIYKNQAPETVSRYALTCYVPYYLPDFMNFELDCGKIFHHELFRFYVLNKDFENIYKNHLSVNSFECNQIKGLGHTMLDVFQDDDTIESKGWVIYAPHWSITHKNNLNNINISTFDENGQLILEYAKKHPEIKWMFKPHPTLKSALLRIGEMTKEEIDDYYAQWENIAKCCYDGSYIDYFKESDVLITDCGSFLLEYFCTNKPLIHLVSNQCENPVYPQLNDMFETFYQVKSNADLFDTLDSVLLAKNDYKKDIRAKMVKQYAFTNNNAAKNIINDLKNTIMENFL